MPRNGAAPIRAWRMESLIQNMAVGDRTDAALAEEFGVEVQTVAAFRMRHKADIQAVVAGMADKFGHIWASRKENRIRVLVERHEQIQELIDAIREDARQATESLRALAEKTGEEYAGEVLVNGPEFRAYSRDQQKILRDIAEEMGQLMTRAQPDNSASTPRLFIRSSVSIWTRCWDFRPVRLRQ